MEAPTAYSTLQQTQVAYPLWKLEVLKVEVCAWIMQFKIYLLHKLLMFYWIHRNLMFAARLIRDSVRSYPPMSIRCYQLMESSVSTNSYQITSFLQLKITICTLAPMSH